MLEQEIERERSLFFLLNGSDSVLMDHFMWLYSYKFTWIPFFLCFLILLISKYKKNWKEYLLFFVFIVILIFLCDRICSGVLKPHFQSFRPTHHPYFKDEVDTVLGYRGGQYGFASSHASNIFGFATFTLLLIRRNSYTALIILHAIITIYTRVYLGVHFIIDVIAGAIVGIIVGFLIYKLYMLCRKNLIVKESKPIPLPIYYPHDVHILTSVYTATIILLLIFNNQLVNILS